jgi:hypothetical protein
MKITLTNTSKIVNINGVPARIWEGQTDTGIPIHCFITRIAVAQDQDCAVFEQELQSCAAPSEAVEAIPFWLII